MASGLAPFVEEAYLEESYLEEAYLDPVGAWAVEVVVAVAGADQCFAKSVVQRGVALVGLTSAPELLEHVAFCICPLRQQDQA